MWSNYEKKVNKSILKSRFLFNKVVEFAELVWKNFYAKTIRNSSRMFHPECLKTTQPSLFRERAEDKKNTQVKNN